jgi:hypothetical protein
MSYQTKYPKLEISLRDYVKNSETVEQYWLGFKEFFIDAIKNKPIEIQDFSLSAECYKSPVQDQYSFYFAFHYSVSENGYDWMEFLYCEFKLPTEITSIDSSGLELWNHDFSINSMIKDFEKWQPYNQIKSLEIEPKIHGTEV